MSEIDQSDGINARAVMWTALAILCALTIAAVAAYFAWMAWRSHTVTTAPNVPMNFPVAGTKLENAPQADYAAYLAEKERLLNAFQWVDEQAGTVRIPIDDAMRLMSQGNAGLPPAGRSRP